MFTSTTSLFDILQIKYQIIYPEMYQRFEMPYYKKNYLKFGRKIGVWYTNFPTGRFSFRFLSKSNRKMKNIWKYSYILGLNLEHLPFKSMLDCKRLSFLKQINDQIGHFQFA